MKRFLFLISLFFCYAQSHAQVWSGFESGRYSGISSANTRPGGMASTPYKVDATVFGIHLYTRAKNIFANEEALDMMSSGGFKSLKGFSELSSTKTSVFANIQGPSILYSVNNKWSVAIAWNMRFMWTSRVSEPKLAKLFDESGATLNLDGTDETATILFNSWNEFGAGAAGIVWEKSKHSVSVGGFAKLVYGGGNLDFNLDNIDLKISGDTIEHMSFTVRANISQQTYDLVDEGKLDLFDRAGYGFDIGAEYKFLNSQLFPGAYNYRLKAGFSLTDIGQMRYKTATQYNQVEVSANNLSLDRLRDAPTLRAVVDTLDEIFDLNKSSAENYKVKLPMAMRLYADVNLTKRFFVYNEFHFIFAKMLNENFSTFFRYNITPRFEDARFGVYLPLTFNTFIPANAGLSLRWKPFIIGSSNLFTFWAYKDSGQAFDIYLTVKVPILKKEERKNYNKKTPASDSINPATSF